MFFVYWHVQITTDFLQTSDQTMSSISNITYRQQVTQLIVPLPISTISLKQNTLLKLIISYMLNLEYVKEFTVFYILFQFSKKYFVEV